MRMQLRTLCQYRLQHRLVTELSDALMRRRTADTPIGRLSRFHCSVAYPWRLYDMVMELAKAGVPILVGAGDNLYDTLDCARQYTLGHVKELSHQSQTIQPVPHIPLRAPTWLHLRILLAAMIELSGVRQAAEAGPHTNSRVLVNRCQIEIGFAYVQLAEGCDACGHCVQSELFHSIGEHYMHLGRQANESSSSNG